MAIDSQQPASRRKVLAAGLGALGGIAATALARPVAVDAAANGNVQLATGVGNTDNDAATETRVNVTSDTEIALSGIQPLSGSGVYGYANSAPGEGVKAVGGGTANGVTAQSTTGTGTRAASTDTSPTDFNVLPTALPHSHKTGVIGTAGDTTEIDPNNAAGLGRMPFNTDEVGVFGYSNVSSDANGVWGDSYDGVGVVGTGSAGVWGAGFWGVWATADGAPGSAALVTDGKILFRGRSGRSYVVKGKNYRDVPITGMTSSSAVIATMQTNRAGVYVQAAVSYAGKFRLYLNKTVTGTTYFSYIVIG